LRGATRRALRNLMSLQPLRTLFFEDLSVGMTDFALFAGKRRSAQEHASG
jgi:hypothetical protein